MNDEIKTEDIIKSLRICAQGNPDACAACVYYGIATCYEELCEDAVDRLERLHRQHIKIQYDSEELTISELCSRMDRLREKLNAAKMENELLRGALASCGVPRVFEQHPEWGRFCYADFWDELNEYLFARALMKLAAGAVQEDRHDRS